MKLSTAGKLWEDEDFQSMKMDAFCKEIRDLLEEEVVEEEEEQPVWIPRLWKEKWEKKKLGPQGNQILEAHQMNKYSGLKLCELVMGIEF